MLDVTVADLRQKSEVLRNGELLHICDGRKREGMGYYIPERYYEKVRHTIEDIEREKKREILKRIAHAQEQDPIGDGTAGDGLETR